MAKVLGKSARYVSNQAVSSFRRMYAVAFITVALLATICGFLICLSFLHPKISPVISYGAPVVLLGMDILIWKISSRKLDTFERQRVNWKRGVTGEAIVAATLEDLSDEFCVINDLTTDFGNLDHVVVGPTGVFVIDAKNWRGIVAADGKGDVTVNGRRPDGASVKAFLSRLMTIKEKVRVLAPETNPYFQALFIFTSAKVDANWGSTGKVLCMRDDQLVGYISEHKPQRKFGDNEIQRTAQAFLSLAKMDTDFNSSSLTTHRNKNLAMSQACSSTQGPKTPA